MGNFAASQWRHIVRSGRLVAGRALVQVPAVAVMTFDKLQVTGQFIVGNFSRSRVHVPAMKLVGFADFIIFLRKGTHPYGHRPIQAF